MKRRGEVQTGVMQEIRWFQPIGTDRRSQTQRCAGGDGREKGASKGIPPLT